MNFYFVIVVFKECFFLIVIGDIVDKGIELGVVVIVDVIQNFDYVVCWYVCVFFDNEM